MLIFLETRVLTTEEGTCLYGKWRRQEITLWEWIEITVTVFKNVFMYVCMHAYVHMNRCIFICIQEVFG